MLSYQWAKFGGLRLFGRYINNGRLQLLMVSLMAGTCVNIEQKSANGVLLVYDGFEKFRCTNSNPPT